ncbi:hypothetical protein [Brevibacterium gallinarum]|uniref:Alkylmercury lyase n=1 Tax=Brevibacterium gallinarum TaxID=2762220 RepID=A0ABR8WRS3_9MICO|nr:hypothetical protein [Brevibacterium gallinarum]MBD8019695.1 hypothetical protein [Brevibacterium gallinarum]
MSTHAPDHRAWLPIAAAALTHLDAADLAHWPPAFVPERRTRTTPLDDAAAAAAGAQLPSADEMEDWVRQASAVLAAGRLRWSVSITLDERELFIVAALLGHTCVLLCRHHTPDQPTPAGFIGTTCAPAEIGDVITALIPDDGQRTVTCLLSDRIDPVRARRWVIHDCPDCPHGVSALLGADVWEQMHAELDGTGFQQWIRIRMAGDLIAATAALAIEEEEIRR